MLRHLLLRNKSVNFKPIIRLFQPYERVEKDHVAGKAIGFCKKPLPEAVTYKWKCMDYFNIIFFSKSVFIVRQYEDP